MKFSSPLSVNQHKVRSKAIVCTHRLDSFFIIFLSERITPYTSFASSSNGKALIPCSAGCEGVLALFVALLKSCSSLIATTIPELEESVFLGLVKFKVDCDDASKGER